MELLKKLDHPAGGLCSKDWEEFVVEDAPVMDFAFTACDTIANEVCPMWPGQSMTAHWDLPDPAAIEGTNAERHLAFADANRMLLNRINIFTDLPMRSLDRMALQKRPNEIRRSLPKSA